MEASQLAWASPLPSHCSLTWLPCSPSTSTASMSTEPGESKPHVLHAAMGLRCKNDEALVGHVGEWDYAFVLPVPFL